MNSQVNKSHYFQKKYDDLNRFISYFYQVDLIKSLDAKSVLEIGKGSGFVSNYLKKAGYKVKTADFDESLKPEYVADVRDLSSVREKFDVVAAYEVLEHIPFEDFGKALGEIAKVSKKYVIMSLPYRSSGFELVLKFPFVRTLLKKPFIDLFLRIPLRFGGIKTSGQHYWEIDSGRWSLGKVRRVIRKYFTIQKEVRPVLNHYHYFFVLEKKV